MTALVKLSKKGEYLGKVDIADGTMTNPSVDPSIGETPKKTRKYHSMFG